MLSAQTHTRTQSRKSKTDPIADLFKSEKTTTALLADRSQLAATISQMAEFAKKDHAVSITEMSYGHALYNILQLPIESQKAIVFAIADKNGTERPEYSEGPKQRGRQPSGRKQLAFAQYGRWPDMLKLEGKNKDTRAGMQITYHVRNFRILTGLIEARETRAEGGIPRRTLKRAFEALIAISKSNRETRLIENLFERLGIEHDDLEEWEEPLAA